MGLRSDSLTDTINIYWVTSGKLLDRSAPWFPFKNNKGVWIKCPLKSLLLLTLQNAVVQRFEIFLNRDEVFLQSCVHALPALLWMTWIGYFVLWKTELAEIYNHLNCKVFGKSVITSKYTSVTQTRITNCCLVKNVFSQKKICSFFHIINLAGGSTEVWTQGLRLVRQALFHLNPSLIFMSGLSLKNN
jgi:hypothetical protein